MTTPESASHESDRLAIVVDDVWETFRIYHERPGGIKERLAKFRRSNFTEFHALQAVNLKVRHGESVGLIGHNGSGKSTLLKVIAKILPPDSGTVVTNGRLSTLLELGAGFHQDLSGRENIYLNGAILGLSRAEVEEQFDSIVEFAGVEEFIDTPVRNYSSGMYVRLGFAVAVHVDPDVLLVDEVLSVGDSAFQEKSLARMRGFNQRGKTVVMVSHDLNAVRALCERTVVLDHGEIVFDGDTTEAIDVYQGLMSGGPRPTSDGDQPGRTGTGHVRVRDARLESAGGVAQGPLTGGGRARLTLQVEATEDVTTHGGLTVGINVRRPEVAAVVYETRTSWRGTYIAPPPVGKVCTVTFDFAVALLSGQYTVDLLVGNAENNVIHDRWQEALTFDVSAPDHEYGVAPLAAQVQVDNPDGVWPPQSVPPPLAEGGPRHHPKRDGSGRDGSGRDGSEQANQSASKDVG